jgi:hypothetical protein
MTWTNSSSLMLSRSNATMDELNLGGPEFGYQGPIFLHVYEDTIFKTYVFALDPVCGGPGANGQFCNMDDGGRQCVANLWGFESGDAFWGNSAETMSSIVAAPSPVHTGAQSLQVSASSDPTLPASINSTPCYSGAGGGTMDLRGKTYSAWVLVSYTGSSYDGTSCRLRAFDSSFNESAISAQAVSAPITPGSWFQVSGVFPSGAVEQAIYQLTVDCNLPADWTWGDPSDFWYVDDIKVN